MRVCTDTMRIRRARCSYDVPGRRLTAALSASSPRLLHMVARSSIICSALRKLPLTQLQITVHISARRIGGSSCIEASPQQLASNTHSQRRLGT